MKRWLRHLIHDKRGQDLAEYALLLGFIAMLMVMTLVSLGISVNLRFADASTKIVGRHIGRRRRRERREFRRSRRWQPAG